MRLWEQLDRAIWDLIVIHLNLHKTFSTPHGGGGPASGPVGCKELLGTISPISKCRRRNTRFSLCKSTRQYRRGKELLWEFLSCCESADLFNDAWKRRNTEASQNAVLNANYMMNKLKDLYTMAYDEVCMHEFVMSLADLKKKTGVSAMDIAKGLLDNGIHPPTMYFPLIVDEALMVEPTETESKETLEEASCVFRNLYEMAEKEAESLHGAPVTTPVTRLDEVGAARHPVLRYEFS